MKLDESTEIVEIKIIDIKTGKKYIPTKRPEKNHQHFINTFQYKNYNIQLRLDWNDIRNGEPTLDADIWILNEMNKKEFIKKGPWHHTKKEFDADSMFNTYKFKFNECELNLITKKTIVKKLPIDVIFTKPDD